MPALDDRTFNTKAYLKLALASVALLAVLLTIILIYRAYQSGVEDPRMLRDRFDDPPGQSGLASVRVAAMGERAVPTLLDDLRSSSPDRRAKAIELLGAIDDPRVIPALAELVASTDVSSQLAGIAALARTGKADAAARIWPLVQSKDDIVRLRAMVAVGLCGGPDDLPKVAALVREAADTDLPVAAWSLGHLQRRLDSLAAHKRGVVAPAPEPTDDADGRRIQAEVDETLRSLAGAADPAPIAKKLASLTDLDFTRGDFGHTIALQVIAVGGPRQIRAIGLPPGADRPSGGVQLKDQGRVRPQNP